MVRLVANLARLKRLRTLELSGSGVSQLPPSLLASLTQLTHLSVDGCRMRMLPVGLGRLGKLQHLSAGDSARLQVCALAGCTCMTP